MMGIYSYEKEPPRQSQRQPIEEKRVATQGKRSDDAKIGPRQRGRPKTAPTLAELRARREEIVEIAARRGAANIRVFGSVARGEAGPDSDVDFLVELQPGRTLFDLSGLILDLEEALGRKVHVVEIPEPSPVAKRIQREALPL